MIRPREIRAERREKRRRARLAKAARARPALVGSNAFSAYLQSIYNASNQISGSQILGRNNPLSGIGG